MGAGRREISFLRTSVVSSKVGEKVLVEVGEIQSESRRARGSEAVASFGLRAATVASSLSPNAKGAVLARRMLSKRCAVALVAQTNEFDQQAAPRFILLRHFTEVKRNLDNRFALVEVY